MKKLYPLLFISVLIYWSCLDPLNIFDSNDEETVEDETINLWGVDYSIENTTVLDLSNSGLTGEIPSEIGNLTNLEKLYLYDNELTGSIPSEIGNLTNLTSLELHYNQLTGEIPESICNIISSILLSNNKLCPPYPSCFVDFYLWGLGEQDTSGCD